MAHILSVITSNGQSGSGKAEGGILNATGLSHTHAKYVRDALNQGKLALLDDSWKVIGGVRRDPFAGVDTPAKGKLPTWSLTADIKDDLTAEKRIIGMFPPDDFSVNISVGSSYGEIKSLNTAHPTLHFLSGNLETVSFSGMMISKDNANLETRMAILYSFVRRDPQLGRPPKAIFAYGNLRIKCFVESVTTTKWLVLPDNDLRQVTFSISLKRVVQHVRNKQYVVDNRFPVWKTITLKKGDTWEKIAKKYYGRADWGNKLRKLYPKHEPIVIKDKEVKKVDLPHPQWMSYKEKPNNRIFKKGNKNMDAIKKTMFDDPGLSDQESKYGVSNETVQKNSRRPLDFYFPHR